MGRDIAGQYATARDVFAQADEILGFSLSTLCFDGPEDELNDTINTQPALYVTSIAILRVLQAELPEAIPAFVSGHSLGELTALAAAQALSFEDGLRLVRERGRLMKLAGERQSGAMAAVLGLDIDTLRDVCLRASADSGLAVVIANDNCPGQTVISGHDHALETAMQYASKSGAKKVVKLAVSIAAHSPLMESVAAEFAEAVAAGQFTTPRMPVYGNVGAAPLETVTEIQQELAFQLTQPVRWTDSIQQLIADGAQTFVEVGSGSVLTGLLKRIDQTRTGIAVQDVESLQKFVRESS
jgi:[acyl-carrier-protein] S-malonyltransferase